MSHNFGPWPGRNRTVRRPEPDHLSDAFTPEHLALLTSQSDPSQNGIWLVSERSPLEAATGSVMQSHTLSGLYPAALPEHMMLPNPDNRAYPIQIPVIDQEGYKVGTANFGGISPMRGGTIAVTAAVYIETHDGTGRFLGYHPHAKFVQSSTTRFSQDTEFQVVSQE